jgi:hypothetical protein
VGEGVVVPVVIAVWPNNTVSVLKVPVGFSATYLFGLLDAEANPTDSKIYITRADEDGVLHIGFDYEIDYGDTVSAEATGLRLDCLSGRLKKWDWPATVVRDFYRSLEQNHRRREAEQVARTMTADELAAFPAAPCPSFTVAEVRAMDPFCGVYFAFNEDGTCHYVGESCDVTSRVSKSRPEIAERSIGVLKCKEHERKRIESYFIGLLDPPGNSQSTASQLAAKSRKEAR